MLRLKLLYAIFPYKNDGLIFDMLMYKHSHIYSALVSMS